MINHPRLLSCVLLVLMWLMALAGTRLRARFRPEGAETKDGSDLVISATLTLLGLIIGFTFSMATARYDQRRTFEEGEANAIGTEWVRCDLLPDDVAKQTRSLLKQYTEARVAFYESEYGSRLSEVDSRSVALQQQLWSFITPHAKAQQNPISALVVSGMNDVLNSQGYTQAAWWNRIPTTAWVFLCAIACVANLLVGYGTGPSRSRTLLLVVLPILVSVAIFLIADIDSPRGGLIRIPPHDLLSLERTFGD